MDLEPFNGDLDSPITKVTNNNIRKYAGIGADGYPIDKVPHENLSDSQIQQEISTLQNTLKGGVHHVDLEPFSGELDTHLEPFSGTLDHPNKTSMWEDIKSGIAQVGNTADRGLTLASSSLFSQEQADSMFKDMGQREATRNQWANPEAKEQGFGGKVTSAVATLPMQLLTAPLGAIDTATKMIQNGESLDDAYKAAKIDAAFTVAGFAIPIGVGKTLLQKAVTGGGANAIQEYLSKLAVSSVAKTQQSKKDFAPNLEDTAIAGIIGSGFGATHSKGKADTTKSNLDLTNLGKDESISAQEVPKSETPLPDLPMDEVPPIIQTKDPLGVDNGGLTPFPELNTWDGTQTKGFPKIEEPNGAEPIHNEVAPIQEDPLGPEATARRAQEDTEGRYQEQNDFNNHPEDTATSIAMRKAQEDAAYSQKAMEEQQHKEDAFQLHEQIKETQSNAMEAERQLDFARKAGEIDYKTLEHMGDKSLMSGVDTLDLLGKLQRGDLPGALSHIGENHPNPGTRQLARWLQNKVGGMSVKLHDESVLQDGDRQVTGYYDLPSNTIGLSGRGGASPHTLLHEVIHGLTSDFLNTQLNHPLTIGLKSLYRDVTKLKEFNKFPSIYNVKEFVSEAMSNPRFQDFLKKTVMDKRTVFSKFLDSVKSMLGIKPADLKTAFDHAVDLSKQVAEMSSENSRTDMVTRLKAAGIPTRLTDFMDVSKDESLAKTGPDTEIVRAIQKMSGTAQALKDFIPAKFTTEQLLEQMKTEKDIDPNIVQKAIGLFTSGGLYQSLKHPNNTLIKKVYEVVGEASDRSQTLIDAHVHPLLDSIRNLDRTERTDASIIRTIADAEQVEITPAELARRGASEKMINYIIQSKKAMDAAFNSINEARATNGKKPIDPRLGYAVTKMVGDFRRPIFKDINSPDGTVAREFVGQIGANTRWELAKTMKKLSASRPEWIIGEEKYLGRGTRQTDGSRQAAYREALQQLVDDSPHVAELSKVLADSYASDAYAYMNAKKHTMGKKGTFGGEGRKPWEEMSKNADDFFKAEVQYAETIFKWGELSKSISEVKPLLSEAEVNQPNAKAWSDAYIDTALGTNPTQLGKGLDSVLGAIGKETGIGSTNIINTGRVGKAYTNTMLLGLNHLYLAVNALQPFQGMPIVKALLEGRGVKTRFDLGTGYSYLMEGSITAMRDMLNGKVLGKMSEFENQMTQYGKEHHIFGNEIIDRSNHTSKNALYYGAKLTDIGINTVESGTNRVVFAGISHMLKDSGMKVQEGLFETAFKLTKLIMHDYRPQESSMIWQHLGPLGNLSKNLTKYKLGQLSQLSMMAREIPTQGSYRPLAISFMSQVAFAGVLGVVAFDEADKLVHYVSNKMGKPISLRKLLLDHASDLATFGMGSLAGLDLHARTGQANIIPDTVQDAVMPAASKIYDVATATKDAITSPSEMNTKRAVREASFPMINGVLDRKWFSTINNKGQELSLTRKPSDFHDIESGTPRNDADKFWKTLGATGTHESKDKALAYENQQLHNDYSDKRKHIISDIMDQYVANGNKLDAEDIKKASAKYIANEGGGDDFTKDLLKGVNGIQLDALTRAKLRAVSGGISGLNQFKRFGGNQ